LDTANISIQVMPTHRGAFASFNCALKAAFQSPMDWIANRVLLPSQAQMTVVAFGGSEERS
jgi:hypothetical protein